MPQSGAGVQPVTQVARFVLKTGFKRRQQILSNYLYYVRDIIGKAEKHLVIKRYD